MVLHIREHLQVIVSCVHRVRGNDESILCSECVGMCVCWRIIDGQPACAARACTRSCITTHTHTYTHKCIASMHTCL